jgi:hypothetical protein
MNFLRSVREISSSNRLEPFARNGHGCTRSLGLEVSLQKVLMRKILTRHLTLLDFRNLPTIAMQTIRSAGPSVRGALTVRTQPIWVLILAVATMTSALLAQAPGVPQNATPENATPQDATLQNPTAQITGTVVDSSGDVLAGAIVVLQGPVLKDAIKIESDDNGLFNFKQLAPGTYHVTITASGFTGWTSPEIVLAASQYFLLTGAQLRLSAVTSTVNVTYQPEEVAMEQVKVEETQRVFGVIPNFYVVYDPNPAPLTTKLKFRLALKTSTDIVTVLAVGTIAGINQAGDTPDYRQGFKGYAERFGAAAGDGLSDIMIGGAILPSLLHQDPRYYYKGAGSNKSRAFHALASPLICKGDSGKLQPNFSSLGGDLGSSALSNLYYPLSNRGAGLVFTNFAISTGERMFSALMQEFVLSKLTARKPR